MKPTLLLLLAAFLAAPALADDNAVSLSLKDHAFMPAEIHVKAGVATTVTLTNDDPETEEFDSASLKIEKIVRGNSTGVMRWRPLAPGRYPFMGERHSDTARGVVIAQ